MKKLFKRITSMALSGAMMVSMISFAHASESNQMVDIALWNANADQASMGNVATANNTQALYNSTENTLQFATNPVDVSGYCSGIQAILYDTTGNGDFTEFTTLSTGTVETGTKNDGTNYTVTYLSSFELDIPDYLTRSGVEYITIKMSVPHTPMDVVVGTGYLDARIRIDWDSATATSQSEIVPNTEMSTGEVESVTLNSGNISLNGENTIVASDAIFTATKITSGSTYTSVSSTLGLSDFDLYDIGLTLGGEDFSLTGAVNLVLPYSNLPSVYRINDDGSKTTLRGLSSAEGYLISTRSMGLYVVVDGVELIKEEIVEDVVIEPPVETLVNPFADTAGHWAEDYILSAVTYGMFNGTSDTTFSPESQMTNGMVITVLHRLAGEPEVANDGATWYSQAMAWGYAQDIIGGYTTFDPEANVTREALSTMLYRYDQLNNTVATSGDLSAFADLDAISDWAVDGLTWANAMGIVTGMTDTTIAPQNEATRAQVATMFCRYVDGVK